MKKPNEVQLKLPFYEFIDMVTDSLKQDEHIELVKEIDAYWGSWDFTHKLFMYVLSVIKEDPKDYKQFLEDMTDLSNPTIIKIMDELGGK